MESFSTPDRTEKIALALARRQPTLTIVLENIHDPHNVSAILRSCDAVGVLKVHLIYTIEEFPSVTHTPAAGTHKWLEFERHESVRSCFEALHRDGFHILATRIDPKATPLYNYDLTAPTALVLGNEHRGISEEVATRADALLYIPMMGMAESLNVSVASAVCLFEALRQRSGQGMYADPQLSPEVLRSKEREWQLK